MPADLPTWAREFHSFSWMHALSLLWTIGAMVVSCLLGRSLLQRGRPDLEERLAGAWGGFVIAINLWSLIYWNLPAQFNLRESLPLQLCDLAALTTPLVLLSNWRWPRVLLFFWGIGLSTQAFATPTLLEGPAHMKYWLFWLVHLTIVGTAVYDLAVRRFRPRLRDLLLATTITVGLALLIAMLNSALGSNYFYIGNTRPERPTIIDKLGPWPERVFILAAIVIGLFTLLWAGASLIDRLLGGPAIPGRPRPILHCSKCGYDLAPIAHRAEHCPECHTPIGIPGV